MHTHDVTNQVPDLNGYNLFDTDLALRDAILQSNAGWFSADLQRFGAALGTVEVLHLADLANRHEPVLSTHDRFGHRIDRVEFHPAWHALLTLLRQEGLHALPWIDARSGTHLARAAGYFLQAQIEAGALCPTTMTYAAIPVLRDEPVLFAQIETQLLSCFRLYLL